MYKVALDARTLETQLRKVAGGEYVTYKDVQTATGMSYRQARERVGTRLEPLPHIKPHKFLARHVAQVITGG